MPIEFSDRALRVVGTNYQGIEFYDDDRALRATIYLDENGNLNISTAVVTTTTTEEGAPSALASAPFLVVSADTTLLGERVFSPGNGLAGSDGGPGASYSLAVQLQTTSGLSLSASGLALGAPSTLTVATSNAVTASSHTHAITTSSNPGAAAAILATDASGNITLQNLTLAGTTGITASGAGAGLTFSATGAHTIQASHASGTLTVTAGSTVTVSAGGNLVLSPTGDITLDPTGNDILPNTGYDLNIGSLTKKFLTLHAAELWVETLVAQDTIATIGGRVIVAPTTTLIADVTGIATSIDVKHNQMSSGDRVLLQANGKMEWMAITSSPSAITGGYRYNVTRNLEGFDGDTWTAGDAVVNTGQAGSGFIDLYSMESVLGRPVEYIYNYNQTGAVYTGNYATSSNWTIFGDGANTQTSDAVYFGVASGPWANLYYYIGTAAVYTATLTWEYWSGAAWTSFSPTTTDFKSTGLKSTTWTAASLTGWAANSVNSITAYWVRVRISAFTSFATQPTQVGKRVYREKSQFGPTIVGWVRNSTTFSDITEAWAIGNLNGLYGYSADDYGIGLGKYGAALANVTLDATNGLRLRSYTDTILQIKNSDGKGYITGVVYLDTSGGIFQGTGTFASPTTGFKLYNSG